MRENSFLKAFVIVLICVIVNANPTTIFATNTNTPDMNIGGANAVVPTFLMTETTCPEFSVNVGDSDFQTINISGLNLSGDIQMTISGTDADQFSLSQSTISQTDSIAPNTTITLAFSPTKTGPTSATLTCSSAGATDITLPLSGLSGLENPVALTATDISESGFKANWNVVPGASEYLVDVYFTPSNPLIQSSEEFNGGTTAPEDWTFTGISGIYSNYGLYGSAAPSLRLDATGDAVTTPILPCVAKEMKFWLKGLSATGSSLLVEGYNGTSWVEIDNITAIPSTAKIYLYDSATTPALPAHITQFRYTYAKVTNNIALDDVSITYAGPATSPIPGSPFTVTGATNKELTGLNNTTSYYYRVTAKNTTVTTAPSNEIQVSGLFTNTASTHQPLDITASNGTIRLMANAGDNVEVYNSTGLKIVQYHATSGLNTIQLSARGLLIVKAGSRTAKILM